jgi:hypothetical protein
MVKNNLPPIFGAAARAPAKNAAVCDDLIEAKGVIN